MLTENLVTVLRLICLFAFVCTFIGQRAGGLSPPEISDHTDGTVKIFSGQSIELFCTVIGFPLPTITWSKSKRQIGSGGRNEIQAKNLTTSKVRSNFTIRNALPVDEGKYKCEAKNVNGSVSLQFKVSVDGKPLPPMCVRSVVVNSTSILVSWKAVETFAEPVVVYTLYYNADEEKQVYAINITATYNTSNYNHVLTGLEPFTTYMMYMTATNEGYGEGGPSESTAEKTLPADPESPEILLYDKTSITHRTIKLKFILSPRNNREILSYQIFVENIQDKPTSSPLPLPSIYGNHSLNKTKDQIYIAADFEEKLPDNFVLGDEEWYGFHYNARLKPLTKYRIYIRALAKVYLKKEKIIYGKAKTLVASTTIPKIVQINSAADSLEISWDTIESDTIYYKLLVKQGENIVFEETIKEVPYKLKGLKTGETYIAYLSVCSEKKCHQSAEGTVLKTTAEETSNSMKLLIIIIAVGAVVLLLIVVIAVVCFIRRRNKEKQGLVEEGKIDGETVKQTTSKGSNKNNIEEEVELINRNDDIQLDEIESKPIRAKPIVLSNSESSTDTKINWECSKDSIKVLKVLENDDFGEICKGSAKQLWDFGSGTVMMRILKDGSSESKKGEFMSIMKTMKKLPAHEGVINLLGCITNQDPLTIIMEYVPYGDLLGYLRISRGLHDEHYNSENTPIKDLSSAELMSFAEQIASGMAHLERYKIMHGDLSARNVLVGHQGLCKLSKFGEYPLVFDEDTYSTKKKGRLLIKWAAIEVLFNKDRTIHSDVWSFGVLLYEIATIGGCPYNGKDEHWLLNTLKGDYRLPCPEHVSEALYSVMLDCWKDDPSERPNFEKLVKVMRTLTLMNKHQDHINMAKYDGQLFSKLDDV